MTINVAINGFGRIGRTILRAHYESKKKHDIRIVAINDLGNPQTNAYLAKYDTTHGKFPGEVTIDGRHMVIDGDRIRVMNVLSPAEFPWNALEVDVVLDCTGFFTTKEKASAHLRAGARKVVISAPGGMDVDATIVYGVNHHTLKASDTVVSNASCTLNCLAHLIQPLHAQLGVVSGMMTAISAYANDQVLTDAYHSDPRRARSAAVSMIPGNTGAPAAIGLVLPELEGRLDGYVVRVPVLNVSMVDLNFVAVRPTSAAEVNVIMREAASSAALRGLLGYSGEPMVSVDFNHNPASCIFDESLTRVSGALVKVGSWYDNEWGYSNRMLDTAAALMAVA